MKQRLIVLASLLAIATSCGGETVEGADGHTDGGLSDSDGSAVDGGDGSTLSDAHDATDAGADDAVAADSSDGSVAPQLPPCHEDRDCDGIAATCQDGYCCAGTFANGQCTCGTGPGCDVLHTCCMNQCTVDCVLPP